MPLDKAFVGRVYPPTEPYEVGREKIREFADAVGETSPAIRDPAAAREFGHPDVIAPPTFPIVLSMRADNQVIFDPALGLDYSRVVHRAQKFAHHRPVRAGDRLTVVVTVTDIDHADGNDMITIRSEISTVGGEPVCTTTSTMVSRAKAGA